MDRDVVTVDEVKDYLGIDFADDMVTNNINRMIKTADAFMCGSIGDNYPIDDPRVKELTLIIISDLYVNRTYMSGNVSNNVRRMVNDLTLQLRLELRRGSDNESV